MTIGKLILLLAILVVVVCVDEIVTRIRKQMNDAIDAAIEDLRNDNTPLLPGPCRLLDYYGK